MIRFFMLFFLTTFSFLCLLLAYLNFAMISRIEARRVSTVKMLEVMHNDMLNVFNRTPAGIKKEAFVKENKNQITIYIPTKQNKALIENEQYQLARSEIETKYPLHFIPFCKNRYQRMRTEWISTTPRKKMKHRVLLVMGLLDLPGFDGSGFYTGDIMQWCDIAAGLAVLGANVEVYGGTRRQQFLPNVLAPNMDLTQFTTIISDYIGLKLFKRMYVQAKREQELYQVACRFRIVDAFGTERSFLQKNKRLSYDWVPSGIDLVEKQILTFEPHHVQTGNFHQNNTFLGYSVPRVQHSKRQSEWRGLLWGKLPVYFKNVMPALKLLCNYIPLSTTTMGLDLPQQCIKSVGKLKSEQYLDFVKRHAIFIGAGEPAMGHGAVEAVAMGLIFMNPVHNPPWSVDYGSATSSSTPMLHNKPTRTIFKYQNTILGDDNSKMAKTYVHNVDMHNLSDVRRVITKIKKIYDGMSDNLTGYVTPQATVAAFTGRMKTILRQEFCYEDKVPRNKWNLKGFADVTVAANDGEHDRLDKPWSKWNKFLTKDGRFLKLGTKSSNKFIMHEWLYFELAKILHLDYIFVRVEERQILTECKDMSVFEHQFKKPLFFEVPVYGILLPYIKKADVNGPKLWTQTKACHDVDVPGALEVLVLDYLIGNADRKPNCHLMDGKVLPIDNDGATENLDFSQYKNPDQQNILDEMIRENHEHVRKAIRDHVIPIMPQHSFSNTTVTRVLNEATRIFTCNTEEVQRVKRILHAAKHRWKKLHEWIYRR